MVLATVAATVYTYTDQYPDRAIFFQGSDPIRTKLYRYAISQNYEELSEKFHIFGILEGANGFTSVPFHKDGKFVTFIVYRKIIQDENSEQANES